MLIIDKIKMITVHLRRWCSTAVVFSVGIVGIVGIVVVVWMFVLTELMLYDLNEFMNAKLAVLMFKVGLIVSIMFELVNATFQY